MSSIHNARDMNVDLSNKDFNQIKLTVSIPKKVKFRLWLGIKLILIGALISGYSIEFKLIDGEFLDE